MILLDGDLQHLPHETPRLLDAARATGADVVIGERRFDPDTMPPSRYHANRIELIVELRGSAGRRTGRVRFHLRANSTAVPLVRPGVNLTRSAEAGGLSGAEGVARYVIPVLAGTTFAAAAVDGALDVDLRGQPLRLQIVADANLFPTIIDDPTAFAVADFDTLFAALNADAPGSAVPSETWFLERDPGPFSSPGTVIRAADLERVLVSAPLAVGTRQLLKLSGVAGASLAVLALILSVVAALRTEARDLAEFEAMGVSPRSLGRSVQARLLTMSVTGLVAGVTGGLLSLALIGALVAVTGTGTVPLPPIRTVVAWRTSGGLVVLVLAFAAAATVLIVRARLRATVAGRLRA